MVKSRRPIWNTDDDEPSIDIQAEVRADWVAPISIDSEGQYHLFPEASAKPLERCLEEDCPNVASKGGRCWAHLKRKSEGRGMLRPVQSAYDTPWDRLTDAALEYRDAKDPSEAPGKDVERAFSRARDKLRKAAINYAVSLGYRQQEA